MNVSPGKILEIMLEMKQEIIALKKHKPHINLLRAEGLEHESNSFSSIPKYEPSILFLNPLGGSLVTLTPFCSIETGNLSLGMEVSHILN